VTEKLKNVYRFRLVLCNGPARLGPSLSSIHDKTEADSESETFWVLAQEDSNKTDVATPVTLARYARRRVKAVLSIDVEGDRMQMMILFYKDRVERCRSFD